jgi:acyl dehydratase
VSELREGEAIQLSVTPDRYVTVRYAGASGDFNPIHIDEEFAQQVGLPGRILHGLWSMAQVARAATDAAGGDPGALTSLKVQFRGMGRLEQEIVVSGSVTSVTDGVATAKLEARQGDARLIRNGIAELRVD